MSMKVKELTAALVLPALLGTVAFAQEHGTAAEAKAMLEKAAAAIKADKAKALATFTEDAKNKNGEFYLKDLYVFCGGPDGNFTAHPTLVGKPMRTLMDKSPTPKPIGEEFYKAADAGGGEVKYMWPLPTGGEPREKVSYITKAGDQVCGVGYYPSPPK